MTDTALAAVDRPLAQALDALDVVAEAGGDAELLALLTRCAAAVRRLDRVTVAAVAGLERRGVFAERGYKTPAAALADLLGWERREARLRVVAAEQVVSRTGLVGAPLPARLPATAGVFAAGRAGLRHVAAIAGVLGSSSAQRLSPQQWAGAEEALAGKVGDYTPAELHAWGVALVEALDQDGDQPDDHPPGDAVPGAPPPDPRHRMDRADPRRAPGVHPTQVDRPDTDTPTKSPPAPRRNTSMTTHGSSGCTRRAAHRRRAASTAWLTVEAAVRVTSRSRWRSAHLR